MGRPTQVSASLAAGHASVSTLHTLLRRVKTAWFTLPHPAAIQESKKRIEMQLYWAGTSQTVNHHNDDYLTAFHLAGRLSRAHNHALLTWTVQLNECMPLSDYYKLNSKIQ